MIKKAWGWIKPLVTVLAIVFLLRVSGLLAPVMGFAQSALLSTGAFNASGHAEETREAFDYSFFLRDLSGEKIDFSTYKGKVVFINLWATWCPPCRAEMPSIEQLYQKEKGRPDIAFVLLSVDDADQREAVVRFIERKQYSFPVFTPSGYLPKQLQVSSIPTTLVIAKDGRIAKYETGMRNYDTEKFRRFLSELAAE